MKYKDYYQTLGIKPEATLAEVKSAYRKLAHQYHPDVSKDPDGEEKFKEVAEAYATLKNPEKRQDYDDLGKRPAGENFTPPPDWQQHFDAGASSFDDVDLADLLNSLRSGRHQDRSAHNNFPEPGENFTVSVSVPLEKIYGGGEIEVAIAVPEYDAHGLLHRVSHTFRINVPKGATDGQRLRLAGKGQPGRHGGKAGDLYVALKFAPHPLYRVSGHDLFYDLPLAPWEAVLGASVEIPTLGGVVELNVKPGTLQGQRMRLGKRGLPAAEGGAGDLYAVVQIVLPKTVSEAERQLYGQLAAASPFNAREHLHQAAK